MILRLCWLVLAAIHAIPALAFFRPALIERLYGVSPGASSYLLLRHRAALFVVVVAVCCWAAFDPATRRLATLAVGISMMSFLFLYGQAGSPVGLRSIAVADVVGVVILAYAGWAAFR